MRVSAYRVFVVPNNTFPQKTSVSYVAARETRKLEISVKSCFLSVQNNCLALLQDTAGLLLLKQESSVRFQNYKTVNLLMKLGFPGHPLDDYGS